MSENLSKKLFTQSLAIDKWLKKSLIISAEIDKKYDPRHQFNLWRNSTAGRQWRKQKFREQLGCCAICGGKMEPSHIHIDHIEPISKRPDLALELTNLRLTHPPCNLEKGSYY